jgi:hypothetical protein
MYTVPSFDDLAALLKADFATLFKVLPPKSSGKNGIMTGSMLYNRTTTTGRKYDDQIAFMGPPCTIIPPIQEGRVRYPKLTLNLNRKDGKVDEYDPRDAEHTEARTMFMAWVKDMEQETLRRVQEDPKAFFGGKAVTKENVFIKHSLREPEEDNYRYQFTCKVDLKDESNGSREDIDWNHIKIDVHDVALDENNQVAWKPITLEDIASRDKVLPIFRSAYPYFEVAKNHRTGELEGHCKIQWCLSGLQRIEKVNDHKRKREDEDAEVNQGWLSKIKEYIAHADATGGGGDAEADNATTDTTTPTPAPTPAPTPTTTTTTTTTTNAEVRVEA